MVDQPADAATTMTMPTVVSTLLVAALAVYAAANVAVSTAIGIRCKKAWLVPLVACAFTCMHFGWGLGFWKRLIVPEKAGRYWGN